MCEVGTACVWPGTAEVWSKCVSVKRSRVDVQLWDVLAWTEPAGQRWNAKLLRRKSALVESGRISLSPQLLTSVHKRVRAA